MAIRVECPTCHQTLEAANEYAGRPAVCPTCRTKVEVPAKVEKAKVEIAPTPPIDWASKSQELLAALPIILAVVAAVICLGTVHEPDTARVVHYFALITLVGISALLLLKRFSWPGKWQVYCAITVAILAAVVWGHFDYSIVRWDEPNKEGDGTHRNVDYIYRGKSHPFYREYDSDWEKALSIMLRVGSRILVSNTADGK